MRVPKIVASLMVGVGLLASQMPAEAKGEGGTETSLERYVGQMARQGWIEIQPGVLQRTTDSGKTERFAYGEEGLRFAVQEAKNQLGTYVRLYKANPTKDGARAVEIQAEKVKQLEIDLAQIGPGASRDLEAFLSNGCSFSYTYTADAYYLTTSQGVGAASHASFSNTCGYVGNVYAHAYVAGAVGNTYTTSTQNDPVSGNTSGTNVSATASRTLAATSQCHSAAEAWTMIPALGLYLWAIDSETLCPPPQAPTVMIGGLFYHSLTGLNCTSVTWTAYASGGTPGYSYAWTIDGNPVGTGSTYSTTLCGSGFYYTENFTLGVTVTDSASQTGSDAEIVTVQHSNGPCNPRDPWDHWEPVEEVPCAW